MTCAFLFQAVGLRAAPVDEALSAVESARSLDDHRDVEAKLAALDKDAVPALVRFYQDSRRDGRQRWKVLRYALKLMPRQEAIAASAGELDRKNENEDYRVGVVLTAASLKDSALLEKTRKILVDKSESGFVQVAASQALSVQGDASGKARAVESICAQESFYDFAIMTLENLKARDMIRTLRECDVPGKNKRRKDAPEQAILRIEVASAEPEKRTALLAAAVNETKSMSARQWASIHLANMGTPEAAKALIKIAMDKNAPGQDAANRAVFYGLEEKKWTWEQIQNWKREK